MPFHAASKVDILFTQTASVTVTNTVTETTLVGTGVGSTTIPANLLAVGRMLRVTVAGIISSVAVPGTLTLRVRLGGIAGSIVLATGVNTAPASLTNRGLDISGLITCRAAGAGGTVFSQGETIIGTALTNGVDWDMINTATVAIDTTAAQALVVSAQWGTADPGNTLTCTNLMIEVLN